MKQIDLILKGVTMSFANSDRDQLFLTMALSSCVNNEDGTEKSFPIPAFVTVSISPYRYIPLKDKCALIARGSEVEFHVTGTIEEPQVTLIKVIERKNLKLEDFLASVF